MSCTPTSLRACGDISQKCECIRYSLEGSTDCLHMGQVVFSLSHLTMQSSLNQWPQGSPLVVSPTAKLPKHIWQEPFASPGEDITFLGRESITPWLAPKYLSTVP